LVRAALASKSERRRELARLPIQDKVRILIELQRLAAETRLATGRPARAPWSLAERA
jgi:hypothetical protein